MKITRTSAFTGKEHTMELDVTQEDLDRCWSLNPNGSEHIQDVFPHLNSEEREFLKSGVTQEEWDEVFGDEDE